MEKMKFLVIQELTDQMWSFRNLLSCGYRGPLVTQAVEGNEYEDEKDGNDPFDKYPFENDADNSCEDATDFYNPFIIRCIINWYIIMCIYSLLGGWFNIIYLKMIHLKMMKINHKSENKQLFAWVHGCIKWFSWCY
eukprot:60104_1